MLTQLKDLQKNILMNLNWIEELLEHIPKLEGGRGGGGVHNMEIERP